MSNKDINWINAVKALCIILVFLRHSENYYGFHLGQIDDLYLTIYVNAFFFVSGYLLFWKQLSEPLIKESNRFYISRAGGGHRLLNNILFRIIIPSVIFSAIEFFPSCIIQGRSIVINYALFKTIGGGTYWFTSALVVAELFLLLLFCTRKNNLWFYQTMCLVFGLIGLIIVRLEIIESDIWAWKQGLIALIFLAMGGIYWRYEKTIDKLMRWEFALPIIISYVIIVVGAKEYNDPLISTLKIQPLGFITSAMACLLLVWLCKKLPVIGPLTFIGQNSLGFYFMSGALPITFSTIANKFFVTSSWWMMSSIWILSLLVAYVFVIVINHWLPWLWDLRILRK